MNIGLIKDIVKVNNTVIFNVDEYSDGRINQFDGIVQRIEEKGVHVLYLSGYRSRNDFIPWEDLLAKVDKRKPWIELKCGYRGHFVDFKGDNDGK